MVKITYEEKLVLQLLQTNKEQNTFELRAKGIANPNNIICNLRKLGLKIITNQKPALDAFGRLRRGVAHYSLGVAGNE
ncbi:MAG: hypothetical protein HWE26_19695 [Alteromonadaceae bacterium]|nr:hypothetical protein [Alteromonadaceae bacterium]